MLLTCTLQSKSQQSEFFEILHKMTYRINQEDNQPMLGAHKFWDELNLDILRQGLLQIPQWQ